MLFEKVIPQARLELDQKEAEQRARATETSAPEDRFSALTQISQAAVVAT